MNGERPEHTSRYGVGFWISVLLGSAAVGVGVWTILTRAGAIHPVEFASFLLGAVVVHDLVVAPLTLLLGTLVLRTAPRGARAVTAGAIAATAVMTVVALPVAFRWGALPDNPSLLPRDGLVGLLLALGVVWTVAAAVLWRRLRGPDDA